MTREEFLRLAAAGYNRIPLHVKPLPTSTRRCMYHAKHQGKNRYAVFQPEMELRAQRRLRMEANLRRALQNEELYLHYQPQIDAQRPHRRRGSADTLELPRDGPAELCWCSTRPTAAGPSTRTPCRRPTATRSGCR